MKIELKFKTMNWLIVKKILSRKYYVKRNKRTDNREKYKIV